MRALLQNQTMHCGYFDTTRDGNHSSFRKPTVVGGRCSLSSEICAQNNPPLQKRRLRQISAYNVSITKDSKQIMTNRKSTTAFQRPIDGVRTLPLSPPKVGSKSHFSFFNKIQFQSNKVCYKVSSCENFQRQSCSITIPPSVHRYWRET